MKTWDSLHLKSDTSKVVRILGRWLRIGMQSPQNATAVRQPRWRRLGEFAIYIIDPAGDGEFIGFGQFKVQHHLYRRNSTYYWSD
jgi:hypothetical protein